MRGMVFLMVIGSVAEAAPRALEAQFLKRVEERVKLKAAERKQQTEDSALVRATEPAESALVRVTAPVETLAATAGGKAAAAVANLGRGQDSTSELEARLREQLAMGRADLPEIRFMAATDTLDPSSEPTLHALARVLAESPAAFLVQGRVDAVASVDTDRLAAARATVVKGWLVANGIPAERVFAAADDPALPEAALVSVVPMQ